MNVIRYNTNYNNKLDNKYYTTIRKHTIERREHFINRINEEFQVYIGEKPYNKARLIEVISNQTLGDLDNILLMYDTGINMLECREQMELFKRFGINEEDILLQLIFERIDENE